MSLPSRRAVLAALGAVPAAALAGCSLGDTSDGDGNRQNYVNGDGTWKYVQVADRTDPVELTGAATDGSTVDVAAWRGQLVVVNVWFAACAPCRVEAPHLAAIAGDTPDVRFLGINTDDGTAVANTFEREFGIPYPSLLDAQSGQAVLALRGTIPPRSIPSTVVLDTEGRPAARVIGKAEEDVLRGLIESVRTGRLDGRVSA